MFHENRFTVEKITHFLDLIEPLVYRRKEQLPPFRYKSLPDTDSETFTGNEVDDHDWELIEPDTYWGTWLDNFTLRTIFTVPKNWDAETPAAIFLPFGDAGDFSHPEALASGCSTHLPR